MNKSTQQLLDSIHPEMKLNRSFFIKIYADEITWPNSSEAVIKALEDAGCSNARKYYNETVTEYQRKRDEELRPVAKMIREKWEAGWEKLKKEGEERRKQLEENSLHQMSNKDLIALLENSTDAI